MEQGDGRLLVAAYRNIKQRLQESRSMPLIAKLLEQEEQGPPMHRSVIVESGYMGNPTRDIETALETFGQCTLVRYIGYPHTYLATYTMHSSYSRLRQSFPIAMMISAINSASLVSMDYDQDHISQYPPFCNRVLLHGNCYTGEEAHREDLIFLEPAVARIEQELGGTVQVTNGLQTSACITCADGQAALALVNRINEDEGLTIDISSDPDVCWEVHVRSHKF